MTEPKNCCSNKNIFAPLLLLLLGIILILNNFNLLPWTVWGALWRFWPVFLIIWGVEIVFGKGRLGKVVVNLVSIIILFFVLAYSLSLVNVNFRSWLMQYIPFWSKISWTSPESNYNFRSRGRLYCNPLDDSCTIHLR